MISPQISIKIIECRDRHEASAALGSSWQKWKKYWSKHPPLDIPIFSIFGWILHSVESFYWKSTTVKTRSNVISLMMYEWHWRWCFRIAWWSYLVLDFTKLTSWMFERSQEVSFHPAQFLSYTRFDENCGYYFCTAIDLKPMHLGETQPLVKDE